MVPNIPPIPAQGGYKGEDPSMPNEKPITMPDLSVNKPAEPGTETKVPERKLETKKESDKKSLVEKFDIKRPSRRG